MGVVIALDRRCPACGGPLVYRGGRPPRWCSAACRQAVYKAERARLEREADDAAGVAQVAQERRDRAATVVGILTVELLDLWELRGDPRTPAQREFAEVETRKALWAAVRGFKRARGDLWDATERARLARSFVTSPAR